MKPQTPIFLALLSIFIFPDVASACTTMDRAGELERKKQEDQYLREETTLIVRGTWHAELPKLGSDVDPELANEGTLGFIDVKKGREKIRYRVWLRNEINCGFPNYSLDDGAYGKFYLKADDDPDDDDMEGGVIDNFGFVHFKPLRRNKN